MALASQDQLIGETVRLLRAERGWTQEQLAIRAGIHKRTVQDVERGLAEPRLATRLRLARALGVHANELARVIRGGSR